MTIPFDNIKANSYQSIDTPTVITAVHHASHRLYDGIADRFSFASEMRTDTSGKYLPELPLTGSEHSGDSKAAESNKGSDARISDKNGSDSRCDAGAPRDGSLDPARVSIEEYVKQIKATTPKKDRSDMPSEDGSVDLTHMSVDDLVKYLTDHPPPKADSIDYTKLMGSDKVMLTGDLTHGAVDPTELGKIADQLKNANPPVKTVGLEMFSSAWNDDFKGYFSNPDKSVTNPKNGQPETDSSGNPVTYRDKMLDHLKEVAATITSTPEDAKKWTDGMISSLEEIKKDGMSVEGIEPPVPHIYDDNDGKPHGWSFPTQALTAISQDTSFKSPDGRAGADLLKDYTSLDKDKSASARAALLDYFKTHKFMTDGAKPIADPNPNKTASDVLESLDKMKDLGFFDFTKSKTDGSIIPMTEGKVDGQKLSDDLTTWRSQVMADKIADTVKDGSRMIASMGSAHVGYNPNGSKTVTEDLKEKGLDSVSLGFAGPDYFDLQTSHYEQVKEQDRLNGDQCKYDADDRYERLALDAGTLSDADPYDTTAIRISSAAKTAGLSGFILHLETAHRPFDYFVSVPSNQN